MDSENFSSDNSGDTDYRATVAADNALICGLEPDSLLRLVRTAVGLPAEALERLAVVADKLRAVEGLPQLDSTGD
ncbi:MAG: hypothetical protein HOQ36_09650 [Nocardia sp.]|nr:hypothetical protein [Nocardia sp.]NUS92661.1 hypothetical protein [Nocardia sp.]